MTESTDGKSAAGNQKTEAAETPAAPNPPTETEDTGDEHGPYYWFWHHTKSGLADFAKRHTLKFIILTILLFLYLFLSRGYVHGYVILVRQHLGAAIATVISIIILWRAFRRSRFLGRAAVLALAIAGGTLAYYGGESVHNYLSLYYRYKTLDLKDLKQLPETDHERIQPLNSVYSLAHEKMADSETPVIPHFVRVGEDYCFTMGIEPVYLISRLFSGVKQVYRVPGTIAKLEFEANNRNQVSFDVGENLLWGRNTYVATCRAFGLWRYLNYEPDGVIYMTDDSGQWVQVVPLIRWTGIIFPWPEFGGVQLIRQGPDNIFRSLRRTLIGCGEYIPPREIEAHPFLKNQNLLSFKVSRYMANSFRFHNGFLAPFPGYHKGDIRIPDMPVDVNDQPFVTYFRMSEVGGQDGLYHYFSLEPFNVEQQGINTSLMVPADGIGKSYIFRHYARGSSLIGVTTVAPKVMNERKEYDWTRNHPVEQRPYIKKVMLENGSSEPRFFWLTTVVTFKDEGGKKFIAGNKPDVFLTDAVDQTTLRMDSLKPASWLEQISSELNAK